MSALLRGGQVQADTAPWVVTEDLAADGDADVATGG
jgi:hypothetical protein